MRGQYRAAAGAFLKGYQTYTRSAKAPENLLKLAMSLQRLGQKDAACSSYSELAAKFPSAPTHVKNTAQSRAPARGLLRRPAVRLLIIPGLQVGDCAVG